MLALLLARPARVHVNFVTYPFEAAILLDGEEQAAADGMPLRTPCTIEDLPARVHRVVFRREGLPDLDAGRVDFAGARQVVGRWNRD